MSIVALISVVFVLLAVLVTRASLVRQLGDMEYSLMYGDRTKPPMVDIVKPSVADLAESMVPEPTIVAPLRRMALPRSIKMSTYNNY